MFATCPHCQEPCDVFALFCPSCGGHLKQSNDPLVDRLVGRYRILKRVGAGGCSTVYKAQHEDSGKNFAVKILRPQFHRNHEMVERFRREAMVLSQVKHENIVGIADFGWSQGLGFYIVMEWLEGPTVKEYILERGAFEKEEVLYFFAQLMDALDTAHQADVIHRDLKLDNLMIVEGSFDRPLLKILDFGVAHIKDDNLGKLTSTGLLVGTPRYMAPEQVQRGAGSISKRTDLYSCGLMLIEMLTGRAAFDKESVQELLYCQVQDTPPDLHELAPDLEFHPSLQEVVTQSVKKDQDERFPSAFAFFSALESAMQASDVQLPSTVSLQGFSSRRVHRRANPHALAGRAKPVVQEEINVQDFEQIFASSSLDDIPAMGAFMDDSLPEPPVFEKEAPSTLQERNKTPLPDLGLPKDDPTMVLGHEDLETESPCPATPEEMTWDRDTAMEPPSLTQGRAPKTTVLPGALSRELENHWVSLSPEETLRVPSTGRKDETVRGPSASLSDFELPGLEDDCNVGQAQFSLIEPDFPMESWMDWEDARLSRTERTTPNAHDMWMVACAVGICALLFVLMPHSF